ncbi:hypothetical protein JW906_06790 [bacterium]|nr:hypothetical protein [bacterium]
MKSRIQTLVCIFLILSWGPAMAQFGRQYQGPIDPAGDPAYEREGRMDGNRVFILFKNNTELSDHPRQDVSRWPNTYYGNKMNDGIGLMIAARVFLTQDTIPVDTQELIDAAAAAGDIDTLYFLQTNYREEMDMGMGGTVEWGLHPAFGYANVNAETPAMSNEPNSWPPEGWPSTGFEKKWPGYWDGRFGMGVIYASLESYVVANDAQDQEYLGEDDRVKYYPRPGRVIGDYLPEQRTQVGLPWGGTGIRVQMRGFQWDNPQARDAVFFEYTIANISDYNLTEVAFGYWLDNNIGGENYGEDAAFDTLLDLSYSWDTDGYGNGGYPTGTAGYAYLESPARPYDLRDNDTDGLIDEKRDNQAAALIGPLDGIANLDHFTAYYGYRIEDLRQHWDADEDQDWDDGIDDNGDGIYQDTEYCGDDVGLDGVGPGELQYPGPDEGECNHRPDFREGVGCEPDFAWLDVSESDMLGLTSFKLFKVPEHVQPYTYWFRNDESMWELMADDSLTLLKEHIDNLAEVFATGVFPLFEGLTERISISELHSYDPLSGLTSADHSAPALFNLKKVVQIIYEKDYRFAMPPKMPTLKATAGDGYVVLTWDNLADTYTREPLLGNRNDFEGYKLYRATDPRFSDPEIITDGEGTPMFRKPIFQCDVRNGKKGFTDYGLQNGMGVKLGDDTGIQHYYIDHDVQNGRTYYYQIVAYDYGIPSDSLRWKSTSSTSLSEEFSIAPSETYQSIQIDEFEEYQYVPQNIAIVTPGPKPAGFESRPDFTVETNNAMGSGDIIPEIISEGSLKPGVTYQVEFSNQRIKSALNAADRGFTYVTNGLFVYAKHDGDKIEVFKDVLTVDDIGKDTPVNYSSVLVKSADITYTLDNGRTYRNAWHIQAGDTMFTDVFDGIRLGIYVPVVLSEFDPVNSRWIQGSAPIRITPTKTESAVWAWDYNIVFPTDPGQYYTTQITRPTRGHFIKDEEDKKITDGLLEGVTFPFYVRNNTFTDTLTGQPVVMELVAQDYNENGVFDMIGDRILVGGMNTKDKWAGTAFLIDFLDALDAAELPQPGDLFKVAFKRPFLEGDSLTFTVQSGSGINAEKIKSDMDLIRVVPNPYVGTNVMEPAVQNTALNQKRRLMFTHIPERCTIQIFTMSGVLIDKIQVPEDGLVSFTAVNKYTNETEQLGLHSGGIVHWDMKTMEGLEIAAGIYLYHVKDEQTGQEKMGKFAVIK